ncbi:phage minor head protein [Oceanobacter mangrovi]|uniref:phage minor head protein n=1 Tax=Oceanobacter mangrovi TaxID=2862510 RepID=UPI001C8E8D4F|nr:phage minor head protein [Oceanobacter mangrovi]
MAKKEPTSAALDVTGRSQDQVQLEFKEQLRALELRLGNLVTTAQWTDMLHNAHDRAFTVAGAMKADLLADLAASIDQRLKQHDGGLEGFRKDFDKIVEKHGWAYKGERNWRTRTIYKTNMLTSYASGRLAQLKNPKLLEVAPYWTYRHNDNVLHPRPHHYHWGQIQLTLRHDHPFWAAHYPPNGWGCHCYVTAKRKPPDGADTVPPDGWDTIDERTGTAPGIDMGWGYQPGATVLDELQGFVTSKTAKLPQPVAQAFADDVSQELGAKASKIKKPVSPEARAKRAAKAKATRQMNQVSKALHPNDVSKYKEALSQPLISTKGTEYGLTEAEMIALRAYTDHYYLDINSQLRGVDKKDSATSGLISVLRSALRKLPNHDGETFRRTTLPAAVLAKHKVNKVLTLKEFTSTSYGADVFSGPHRLVFYGKSGKRLGWISVYGESEREVLFNSPTRFRVIDRFTDDAGIETIVMKEVP